MLRESKENRTLKENLMLASSTAFVAGATNVAGVIAFLAFTSNITGHVATLARNVVEQNKHEEFLFFIWLLMFLLGSFLSNFLVRSYEHISKYRAHAIPILIEMALLLFVAIYGHNFYKETDLEREVIISLILLAMGLQNGLVSTISGGLIKTSHLSGLFTDLGNELSEWLHPRTEKTQAIKHKIFIRLTILGFYFLGGIIGALLFYEIDFNIFYLIPVVLLAILYYDVSEIARHKLVRFFTFSKKGSLHS